MLLQKIGYEHWTDWKNSQDFGFVKKNIKCVVDGCSSGRHSEVGAKLFCHLFQSGKSVEDIFHFLTTNVFTKEEDIANYLLFTILFVTETEEEFVVTAYGDGYILTQDKENRIAYDYLDYGNEPPYYAYRYVQKEHLKKPLSEVPTIEKHYSKKQFQRVGVATDGLQYILKSRYKEEFEKYLIEQKPLPIQLLINRTHLQEKDVTQQFSDDITLAM